VTISIHSITFDCVDAAKVGTFWANVLGRELDPEPTPFFTSMGHHTNDGQGVMMFIQVPEGKTVKNRVHLDLQTLDREAEVARLVELGATVHSEHHEYDTTWTTLLDPEGNEFCIASQ